MYPPDRDPEEFYRTVLFPQKARADLEYCSRANIWRDFCWMIWGSWTVLSGAVNWGRVLGLHGRIVFVDLVAIELAWVLANLVRFGELPDDRNLDVFISGCWLIPVVVGPLMMIGGCYRHPVRLFALVDALRLLLVTAMAWGLAYMILLGFLHRYGSVMLAPLGLLLVLPMMIAPRLWWREKWLGTFSHDERAELKKLIVYGAGRRGSALISLLQHGFPKAEVVGFLDDDDAVMRGRVIRGYRVLGSERDLNTILALKGFEQLWLTFIPEDHKYHRLMDWCAKNNVELIVLPTTPPFSSLIYGEHGERIAKRKTPDSRAPGDEGLNESGKNVVTGAER
jgi:FlaA1/EpsC-like NDP-sugar epimerase